MSRTSSVLACARLVRLSLPAARLALPAARLALPAALLALPAALLGGCGMTRAIEGGPPVVRIETAGGTELGVNTDLGVLFMGRTRSAGHCKVTVFFGGTPVVENSTIETIHGGLCQARLQIQSPAAPIFTEYPTLDESLYLLGVRDDRVYRQWVEWATDEDVRGNVLEMPDGFTADQVGAPIFVDRDGVPRLVGIVKAAAKLQREGQEDRWFLTFAGLDQLREALLAKRPAVPERGVFYREDEVRTRFEK